MRKVTIIGAGLVGSLLSLYLIKLGHEVELYEKRPDGRKLNIYEGRSINLALSHRGIKALKEVGIFREIEDILIPMLGRQMHDLEGIITYLPYGKDDSEFINSVSRSDLNFKLMTAAEVSGRATIHFDHECIDYLGSENKLTISSPEGEKTIYPELLFGTDGANSAIRDTMKREGAVFSIDKLSHGYKELVIPALENNKFAIEKNVLHIWPRGAHMMIALPNIDGSFTVTLFFANEGKESFESLTSDKVIKEFFDRNFKDVTNVMPDFLNIYKSNPVGSLATITSDLWHIEDKVLILGDASHGIVPFYGQGMNAGFEDCSVLYNIITNSENKDDWETIFKKLQESRKPNTDAIAQLSLDNFIEMRDSMSNALGLLRKKAETMLYDKYPDEIISKYSMVSFHPEISYKKAYEKGKILENTFADLIRSENDDIDLELAYKTIIEQFERLILEID